MGPLVVELMAAPSACLITGRTIIAIRPATKLPSPRELAGVRGLRPAFGVHAAWRRRPDSGAMRLRQ